MQGVGASILHSHSNTSSPSPSIPPLSFNMALFTAMVANIWSSFFELLTNKAFIGGIWLAVFGGIMGSAWLLARKAIDLFSRCALPTASQPSPFFFCLH